MRTCPKCNTPFGLVGGLWQCPKCYEETERFDVQVWCKVCGQVFFNKYSKTKIKCIKCGSELTELLK